MKGESAKHVAIDVLRAAAGPLKAKEVAKRVIDSGRCAGLEGQDTGGDDLGHARRRLQARRPFKRVDKDTYTLDDASTPPATDGGTQKREAKPPTQRRAAKPRTQKRQPAKRTS